MQTLRQDVLILYMAICAHKVFTVISLSTRFLRLGCPLPLLTVFLLPFHLLPPLAIVAAAAVGTESSIAALFLMSLATGTFLYVGAFEVVSEEFGHSHDLSPMDNKHIEEAAAAAAVAQSDDPVMAPEAKTAETVSGGAATSPGDGGNASDNPAWYPSKVHKFLAFLFGCGAILAITAVLPEHRHA